MTYRLINASEYLTHDSLSGGDYGGAGYLARVNCETLRGIAEADPTVADHVASCGMSDWSLQECIDTHGPGFTPALIIAHGGYGSVTAYVHPDWQEGVDCVEALDDYPVLDDEALTEFETQAEIDCWDDYGRGDLKREILELIDDETEAELVEEWLDDNDAQLDEWFQSAAERLNVYREIETSGSVYWPGLPECAEAILRDIRVEIDPTPHGAVARAIRDGLIPALPM